MTTGGAELEQSLGFQLKLLQVEADARAREALSSFDITPARVSALMMIRSNPGCTQTALGEALSVNRASAMKIVNYLEGRGFVERQASADPRANALQLTDTGRDELDAMTRALHNSDQETLARLSVPEADLLLQLIHKLRSADTPS
ncbi:MAG: MarR family transcriptional regulator [Novosphingobium lindaniclasticum]|uniref:MarR family winged helix-turn-helix transcriptional regulator n=1 Tax=Novosphingobium lindaniclasticum TaxID=1329895 RepID=UPI002409BECA|nr:MarR family transcriptional regulator [Novosphingobium lindaniclasticum]MDF2638463.1 MarR family transcriptional regulator [Novosphingobium lindaniclasticum]